MADAMKLVPVEPTEAMLSAVAELDWFSTSDVSWADGYRAMLAASPPAREEAPAEGAGELIADLEALLAAEPVFVVNHPIQRAITALRNRTSEPAREAVAWPCGPNPIGDPMEAVQHPNGRWCVEQVVDDGAICMTWFDGPYAGWRARNYARTRPDPATADKLKVAKEALEKIASRRSIVFGRGEMSGQEAFGIATDALAILQEPAQ